MYQATQLHVHCIYVNVEPISVMRKPEMAAILGAILDYRKGSSVFLWHLRISKCLNKYIIGFFVSQNIYLDI